MPDAFGLGIVIPVPKDVNKDLSSVDNYRPITLSPMISKVLELVLLNKFQRYLFSDKLQFGFKQGSGCRNALFLLREVVQFYNRGHSNVYLASLDATKAFDRVSHEKLFQTLRQRGLPIALINTIANWYSKLYVQVRWQGCLSSQLHVTSGVMQGGILSPFLFNVYVNCLITGLRSSKLGCQINNCYIGCIMYADDLLLLSASVVTLQKMLDVCSDVAQTLDIKFNCSKSFCLMIGSNKLSVPTPMTLSGNTVVWTDKIKYLGVHVPAGSTFTVDLSDIRRKFFSAVNYILSNSSYFGDIVKLDLMEKHCLPLLLYCTEILDLSVKQISELNSWWNAVYRRIFGYHKWESVRELIRNLGRLDFKHLLNVRTALFHRSLADEYSYDVEQLTHDLRHRGTHSICSTLHVQLDWSRAKIQRTVFETFNNSI